MRFSAVEFLGNYDSQSPCRDGNPCLLGVSLRSPVTLAEDGDLEVRLSGAERQGAEM